MGRYLVEHYWPGVRAEEAAEAVARARDAAEALTGEGVAVALVSATFVERDELLLSVYDASSVDAVEQARSRAGLRVDRISACVDFNAAHPLEGTQ